MIWQMAREGWGLAGESKPLEPLGSKGRTMVTGPQLLSDGVSSRISAATTTLHMCQETPSLAQRPLPPDTQSPLSGVKPPPKGGV